MDTQALRKRAHDLDVTLWVGKGGVDTVVDECDDQLKGEELVKVKFLRSAQGGTDVESLATDLAERTNAAVVETRGNTAVLHR
ncbi:YhbY family RNA-binding protein [Haloplanus rallus]|jgi:RNA-binding protein|uniref:YhbY family RNA-binding protein n=1 Tax=Haloplanus rallus TaxID=1816183 RepID=A0A6B9FE36_9EURY|nr:MULTISPECIES: YhbY family RNA-binding protein [Haloplanus]QGX94509.1 YhbY family RNA-binding protein [Haloplanus rallus]